MQKLEDNMSDDNLNVVIDKLENRLSTLLDLYREQSITIKQLKKDNLELKKQFAIDNSKLEISDANKAKISDYIKYIDTCIEYIQTKINE